MQFPSADVIGETLYDSFKSSIPYAIDQYWNDAIIESIEWAVSRNETYVGVSFDISNVGARLGRLCDKRWGNLNSSQQTKVYKMLAISICERLEASGYRAWLNMEDTDCHKLSDGSYYEGTPSPRIRIEWGLPRYEANCANVTYQPVIQMPMEQELRRDKLFGILNKIGMVLFGIVVVAVLIAVGWGIVWLAIYIYDAIAYGLHQLLLIAMGIE